MVMLVETGQFVLRRPMVIDAFQWNGKIDKQGWPDWARTNNRITFFTNAYSKFGYDEAGRKYTIGESQIITNLRIDGNALVHPGDWVIKDRSALYSVGPSFFKSHYRKVA